MTQTAPPPPAQSKAGQGVHPSSTSQGGWPLCLGAPRPWPYAVTALPGTTSHPAGHLLASAHPVCPGHAMADKDVGLGSPSTRSGPGVPDLPPHGQKQPTGALGRPLSRPSERPPKRGCRKRGARAMAESEAADKGCQTGGPSTASRSLRLHRRPPSPPIEKKVSHQRARPREAHKHGDIHQIRSRAHEIRPWRARIRPNDTPDHKSW